MHCHFGCCFVVSALMQFLCFQFCSCARILFIAEAFLCVSDSGMRCFLLWCFSHFSFFSWNYFFLAVEVFCASLRQHYCGFCFNTCASCFWFWHGRCNCFASCRVSSPRFLTVSFFFVATFLFLHYFWRHLQPAQAKGFLVLLVCHLFHQVFALNFLSWTVKRRCGSPVCKEISAME